MLADPAQADSVKITPSVVVCDIALDTIEAVGLLRNALSRMTLVPGTPVICIMRDPSHLAVAQARMAGATATLPVQVSPDDLRRHVFALLDGKKARAQHRASPISDLADGAKAVHAILEETLRPKDGTLCISADVLESAGDTLLSTVRGSGIRAWLELVRTHDDITYQHCLLVSGLTAAFALELGLAPRAQNLLSQAALVHDIGKAQIPREILNKAGKLSPCETEIMRSHPARGYAMLAKQPEINPHVLDVVRHHHEYLDGSGYPDRLEGQQISRIVRIVTICDIYAALIERRSYKEPAPPQAAFAHLQTLESRLDSHLLKTFKAVTRQS